MRAFEVAIIILRVVAIDVDRDGELLEWAGLCYAGKDLKKCEVLDLHCVYGLFG